MARLGICILTLFAAAIVPQVSAGFQTTAADAVETAKDSSAPETPRADLSAVNELVLEGSYDEAEKLLAALHEEFPEDAAVLLLQGEVLLANRKPELASVALKQSIQLDPDKTRAHFQFATALNALGQGEAALQSFAVAASSDDPQIALMARLNRSTLFAQSRKWAEAAAELEAVLELQPDNVQVYGDLAAMHLRAGKTAETAAVLERGRQAGFQSAQHYYSLGARLYRDKNHAAAVEALTAALDLDPSLAKAERSLAASLEKVGRDEEALAHFRRYLELAPDAADAAQISAKIARAEAR